MQTYSPSRRHFLAMAALAGTGLVCTAALPLPAAAKAVSSALLPAAKADQNTAPLTETRVLLGTFVSVSLAGVSLQQGQDALDQVFAEISRQQGLFSRYDSASPLSGLNSAGRLHDAPPEFFALVEKSQRVAKLTGGAFDSTIKPVLDLFSSRKNPQGAMRIAPAEVAAARQLVGFDHVRMQNGRIAFDRQGMGMTLDGIAKGHIIDCASTLLLRLGIHNHLINAGGDIVAQGYKVPASEAPHGTSPTAWTVAVENPAYLQSHGTRYPEVLSLHQGALATSGSYEIFYDASREHHHIINPASGSSPTQVSSVSVLAPTAVEADALATALSVMPPQEALRFVDTLPRRECCILGSGASAGLRMTSRGWNA